MISEEQKEQRKMGLGGSDLHNILNAEPYGCERKLWYQKTNQHPDLQEDLSKRGVIKRGNKLESLVVDEFCEANPQYTISDVDVNYTKEHNGVTLIGNADAVIEDNAGNVGILECKTINAYGYKDISKHDRIPMSWRLQVQWYMYLSKKRYAVISVLWADGWEYKDWRIPYDEELVEEILESVEHFNGAVAGFREPPRLQFSDKRCTYCDFKSVCQDAYEIERANADEPIVSLREDMQTLFEDAVQVNAELSQLKKIYEDIKREIKECLGEQEIVWADKFECKFTPVISQRFNSKKFKEDHPELYKSYVGDSVSKRLSVKKKTNANA